MNSCNNGMYNEGTVYDPARYNGNNNARQMIYEANRIGDQRIREMQMQANQLQNNNNMMMPWSNNAMQDWSNNNGMSSGWTQNSVRPESLTNPDFLPAYLTKQIGKWVRVDFLIGGGIEQRVGILEEVGASYIILNVIEPATLLVCDLFSIKFVTVVLDDDFTKLTL